MSATALLASATPAPAGDILRRNSTASPAASAAAAAVAGAGQAAAMAQRSMESLSRATAAMRAAQAAQSAARSAALAAPSSVPDGLAPGGLQVAPGATPSSPLWLNANAPTQAASGSGTAVEIQQTAQQAILNWQTFNVGKSTTVHFNQSAGTQTDGTNNWVALNRVNDPSGVPSQILGTIKAEGSVYVINRNGIIFGGASQVNVHGLVASSLGITDQQFLKGIVNPTVYDTATARMFGPVFANTSGIAGDVTVLPGAVIQTAPAPSVTSGGGGVYLFGTNVTNSGTIITPDGQTILAAGSAVYLTQSMDPNVRGAEVNLLNGGTVTNTASGYIGAPTGNISVVGLNVKQSGVLSATTSVDEAGSVSLIAHDGVSLVTIFGTYTATYYALPTRLGTVELSPGSTIAVLPEENGRTALDGQPQGRAAIKAEGLTVNMLSGAQIVAPSGNVALRASNSPTILFTQDYPAASSVYPFYSLDAGRVYVGDGAVIDVSGLQNVAVPASNDVIKVNVRGNELRDSPLQRGGILYGKDVWVNVHDLNPTAADRTYTAGGLIEVSGWLGLVPRSIDERLTTGGSVSLFSTGDAITRPGAFVNMAGGTIAHQGGMVNVTRLVGSDGHLYDINHAPADLTYVSIGPTFTVDHPRWGAKETYSAPLVSSVVYQPAYYEGKSAGSLTFATYRGEFDAAVNADALNGIYQRSAATMAQHGALTIGSGLVIPGNVVIAPTTSIVADVFANSTVTNGTRDPATLLPQDWQNTQYLSAALLNAPAYGSITINSGQGYGNVAGGTALTGGAAVKVADGGSIALTTAGSISLDGQLLAHAGTVTLTTAALPAVVPVDVILKPGASIDVTGLWTNDLVAGGIPTPTLYNGGSVTISAFGGVTVSPGALIDASSGGWLQQNGKLKLAGSLPVGTGGNITLATNLGSTNNPRGDTSNSFYRSYVTLAPGSLRSYGLSGGGSLRVLTRDIQIGGAAPSDVTTLWLDPSFFATGGFGQYNLISDRSLTVAPGTDLELHSQVLIPTANVALAPTGSSVFSVAAPGTPQLYQKAAPVSLLLSAVDPLAGNLVVGKGAAINTDPGAAVSLHASRQLTFDGVINAPGGTINLDLYGLANNSYLQMAPTYSSATTLWIGADAQLLARGLVQTYVGASGQPAYGLWDGGSVNINQSGANTAYYPSANYLQSNVAYALGSVVAQAGAVIDVSGASGTVSAPGRGGRSSASYAVATNGGSLNILASQGLFLDAVVNAQGGGPTAAGGSLTIDQTMWAAQWGNTAYVQPTGRVVVTQSSQPLLPAGLNPGDPLPAALQGQLNVSADKIASAGFADVSLGAVDAVVFSGDVNLRTSRSLTINASSLSATPGANVRLSSSYIDIGGGQRTRANDALKTLAWTTNPMAGTAILSVNANLIDIEGTLRSGASVTGVALPGFASMSFTSAGDIRLVPASQMASGGQTTKFTTLGDLTFTAAQLYPITSAPTPNPYQPNVSYQQTPQSLFKIAASGPTSTITINSNGPTPPAPLSAGGMVQIVAPTINQNGVLRAPLGQIILGDPTNTAAVTKITLSAGSITSVSAEGLLIPYGGPQGALYYIYGFAMYGTPNQIYAPIEKVIGLYGKSVTVAGRINEAGGGDLYGYQFVSGSGGSVDRLNGVNSFAVVPSLGAAYAPRSPLVDLSNGDPSVSAPNVNLRAGDQVYLSGVPGLAAGTYTLLPGHYALLPGAFAVTVAASNMAPSMLAPNLTLPSGAYYVSGYRSVANTSIQDSLRSQFVVTPGSVVRQQSQYLETTATQFFQAQAQQQNATAPRLPVDAGRIVLSALNALTFTGQSDFSIPPGGRGGRADIVGTKLELLGPGDVVTPGYIGLDAGLVQRIGAQSVLIGGLRSVPFNSNQLQISQPATNIEIGSHAVLQAPEILLRASNAITLDPGAVIDTTRAGAIPDYFPLDPTTGQTTGSITLSGGVFVLASNAPTALPVTLTGSGSSSVTVGAGARLIGGGSIALASTNSFSLDPSAVFGAPAVTLAAPVINLGTGATSGMTLTTAMLGRLTAGDPTQGVAAATTMILNAAQAVNVYGGATLSGAGGSLLTINTPVIQGFGAAGDGARIAADRLMLTNTRAGAAATATGQGSITFDALELTLGAGTMAFGGFGSVTLGAAAQVIGSGAGVYGTTGSLTVATPLVTAKAGADTTINATGSISFTPSSWPLQPVLTAVQSLGAHLTVNGASISQGTAITLPSGVVTLHGQSGVTLAAGSVTDVSGAVTPFFDVVRISPAGTVNLQSPSGNVIVGAGTTVNVSGGTLASVNRTTVPLIDSLSSDIGGDAGTLIITAPAGTAQISGTVLGGALPAYSGGKAVFNLGSGNAGLLGSLTGFTGKQALTLASGDIAVGNMTAQDVELSASTGTLTVSGRIDASGPSGGIIRLSAGNALTLASGASLDAHATNATGNAGSVFLGLDGLSGGTVTLAAGSSINVAGNGLPNNALNGGKVWLRAPRRGGTAVAIVDNGVAVTGAREIDAEAVAVTDITATPYVDANLAAADSAATAYIANAGTINTGIGALASNPAFHLVPGIEFRSTGNVSLMQSPSRTNTGIDLHTYRYNGEPMALTLRAAGNLTLNGSLSDGFGSPVSSPDGNIFAIAPLLPQGSRSATLRLAAGANVTAADPDALVALSQLSAGSGSIVFNDPHNDAGGYPIASVLRTGTGDLEIAAGRDITITTPFGIYAAGYQSGPVAGFTTPTRPMIRSMWAGYSRYFGTVNPNYLGYKFVSLRPAILQNWDTLYPTALYPSYPVGGGNVTVTAQGNLTSVAVRSPSSPQGYHDYAASAVDTYWLWTMGQANPAGDGRLNGTWFINFGTYYQSYAGSTDSAPDVAAFRGFGALGGGSATVTVGGSMTNVDVSVPSTGRLPLGGTGLRDAVVTGGGNLSTRVGGLLDSAHLLVGRGTGSIRAQDLGTLPTSLFGASHAVEVAVGDAQVAVAADRNQNILIVDPTREGKQEASNPNQYMLFPLPPMGLEGCDPQACVYSTYGAGLPWGFFTSQTPAAALDLLAAGGTLAIGGDFVPANLSARAPAGSIISARNPAYSPSGLPSATAQLDMLAGQGIAVGFSEGGGGVSDVAAAPGWGMVATIVNFTNGSSSQNPWNLTSNDPRTNHVYAVKGDIGNVGLSFTKRSAIRAGRDIAGAAYYLQNNAVNDVSLIQAGRDITDVAATGGTSFNIRIAGPGMLEVQAGRNLTVQSPLNPTYSSTGIASVGNADNPLLPHTGASISVAVGVGTSGPDLAGFIATYFAPGNPGGVLHNYLDELTSYMRTRERNPALTSGQALADFRALWPSQQLPFIEQVYFAELKAGGEAAANGLGNGGKGYDRTYKAIQTLFPGSTIGTPTTAYKGNLSLYNLARIRTESGGDIDVLVPGGGITLGFENQTPNLAGKTDTARPGLLTLRGGNINTFTDQSVIVAQSRVFTELGGDILMYSTNGDLNAGKGKKTTLVTSPPQFTVDPYGNVTKAPVTPQTGAGIATLIGVPGVTPGNVDLFAPHGTIDAGDAGIRVSGNLTLDALHLLNAGNIQVQGTAVGLPAPTRPDLGALTAASNAAGAASAAAEAAAGQSRRSPGQQGDLPSIITVEVIGYGGNDQGDRREPPLDDIGRAKDRRSSYDPADPIQVVGYGPLNRADTRSLTQEERRRLGQ